MFETTGSTKKGTLERSIALLASHVLSPVFRASKLFKRFNKVTHHKCGRITNHFRTDDARFSLTHRPFAHTATQSPEMSTCTRIRFE